MPPILNFTVGISWQTWYWRDIAVIMVWFYEVLEVNGVHALRVVVHWQIKIYLVGVKIVVKDYWLLKTDELEAISLKCFLCLVTVDEQFFDADLLCK